MEARARVARNLRLLRGSRGLTQEALAGLAGLGARYVGMIEREERGPTVDTLGKLAHGLGVDFHVLTDPALGDKLAAEQKTSRRTAQKKRSG